MNEFMKAACELSAENLSLNSGGPCGAVVVKDGKIIGRGRNHVLEDNDPTAHGEVMAIRDACKNTGSYDLSGCELYTSAYPCPMCMAATVWANIKKIYYGNTRKDAEAIGFRDDLIYELMGRLSADADDGGGIEIEQLDHEETIKVFEAFERKMDKTIY